MFYIKSVKMEKVFKNVFDQNQKKKYLFNFFAVPNIFSIFT